MLQPEKIKRVEEISTSLSQAKSIFLTDFSGLTVEEMTSLRKQFREANVKYIVVKNTLTKLSAEKEGLTNIIPYLSGPTGLALSYDDPVAPVRIISAFRKDKKKPGIKAAILEGQLLDKEAAEAIKNIPTREVLLAQIASGFAAPISGFVSSLQSLLSKLLYALNAIAEKKES